MNSVRIAVNNWVNRCIFTNAVFSRLLDAAGGALTFFLENKKCSNPNLKVDAIDEIDHLWLQSEAAAMP